MSLDPYKNETVVLGRNLYSYVLGFRYLLDKEKVLLVDEPTIGFGGLFGEQISFTDTLFLISWGEQHRIESLKNLYDYCEIQKNLLVNNNIWVYQGDDSYGNFLELARNLPEIFGGDALTRVQEMGPEQFNRDVLETARKVVNEAMVYGEFIHTSSDLLSGFFSGELEQILKQVKAELEKESEHLALRPFFDLCRSGLLNYFGRTKMTFDFSYIFLCLLLPRYKVNLPALLNELSKEFRGMGGMEKKTTIEGWQFYKNQFKGLQLGSYEGVLKPRNVVIMGKVNSGLPFQIRRQYQVINCFTFEFRVKESHELSLPYNKVYYSKKEWTGTSIPLIVIDNKNPKEIHIHICFKKGIGSKSKLFYAEGMELAKESLSHIYGPDVFRSLFEEVAVSDSFDEWGIYSQASSGARYKEGDSLFAPRSDTEGLGILRGLTYKGPLLGGQMGSLGVLLNLKSSRY